MFKEEVPKREVHAPLEPGDHPELDDSPLLEGQDIKHYWQMIGELQWAISLGRIDLCAAVMTMARFRPAPRQGHLSILQSDPSLYSDAAQEMLPGTRTSNLCPCVNHKTAMPKRHW